MGAVFAVHDDDAEFSSGWPSTVTRRAQAMLEGGTTGTIMVGKSDGEGENCGVPLRVFVESSVPAPRMLVFGAVDHAAALVRVGRLLGYRVTVCDARPVFATPERFPDADEIVVSWPDQYLARTSVDRRTVICVLTHDPKFDVPVLAAALRLPVAFIGAMGSRRTCADRAERLRAAGVSEDELARLRAPIGLDLGAVTPEETALSIGAEVVASLRGGLGAPLSSVTGPIHRTVLFGGADRESTREP
jgi:xanthine dehydrogenase accessory factor